MVERKNLRTKKIASVLIYGLGTYSLLIISFFLFAWISFMLGKIDRNEDSMFFLFILFVLASIGLLMLNRIIALIEKMPTVKIRDHFRINFLNYFFALVIIYKRIFDSGGISRTGRGLLFIVFLFIIWAILLNIIYLLTVNADKNEKI